MVVHDTIGLLIRSFCLPPPLRMFILSSFFPHFLLTRVLYIHSSASTIVLSDNLQNMTFNLPWQSVVALECEARRARNEYIQLN